MRAYRASRKRAASESDTRSVIIQVRLSRKHKALVEAAAKWQRRTVSAWLRALVLDALDAREAEAREPGERQRGKRK